MSSLPSNEGLVYRQDISNAENRGNMLEDDPAVEGFDANENITSAPASFREDYTSHTSFPRLNASAGSSTITSNSIYAAHTAAAGADSHDSGAWNLAPLSDASSYYYYSHGDATTSADASHDAKRQRLLLGIGGSSRIGLYPKRDSYARISCQACRKKKSRCVIRAGLRPSREALQGDDRCERCVKMDLTCVIWTPTGRFGDMETGSIFSSSNMPEVTPPPQPTPQLAPQPVAQPLQPPDVPVKRKRGRPRKYPRPEDLEAQAAAAAGISPATNQGSQANGAPAANAVANASSAARPAASSKKRPDPSRVNQRSGGLVPPAWPPPHPELLALHGQSNMPGSSTPHSANPGSSSSYSAYPPAAPAAGLLGEDFAVSGASTPILSERSLALGSRFVDEASRMSDMDTPPPPPLSRAAAPPRSEDLIAAEARSHAFDDGSKFKSEDDAPDGLKEAASLTGDPYSLYSQFCLHLDGFASSLQGGSSSKETLDILKIVNDSMSRSLEIETQAYLLFYPHLFPIKHVRRKVASAPTPSSILLLSTLYLLCVRSNASSRKLLLNEARQALHNDDASDQDQHAEEDISEADVRLTRLHDDLCHIIRLNTEDVLLSFDAGGDDYAVQALELLACYHPLALGRVSSSAITLGEELLAAAISTSQQLKYDRLSVSSCSMRFWSNVTSHLNFPAPTDASLDEAKEFFDLNSAKLEKHSGAFGRYYELHDVEAEEEERAPRQTRASALSKNQVVAAPPKKSKAELAREFQEGLRAAGRAAIAGRLHIVGLVRQGARQIADFAIDARELGAVEAFATKAREIIDRILQAVDEAHAKTVVQLKDLGNRLDDTKHVYQYASHALLLALELDVLWASDRICSLVSSKMLKVTEDAPVDSSTTAQPHANGVENVARFYTRVQELSVKQVHISLSLIPLLTNSVCVEAVPVTSICASAVSAAKRSFELVARTIDNEQQPMQDIDKIISMLDDTVAKLSGYEGLSKSEHKMMSQFGVEAGDLRISCSAMLVGFAKTIRLWRSKVLGKAQLEGDQRAKSDAGRASSAIEESAEGQNDHASNQALAALSGDKPNN